MSNNISKRKAEDDAKDSDSDDSSSSYDPSVINVDFDFQAPSEIDFQAIKRLLQQLFYTHASSDDGIALSTLAQHVIDMASGEAALGTVIKVEGDEDMDPFAFISVVDLSKATSSAAGSELSEYLQARLGEPSTSSHASSSAKAMQALFGTGSSVASRPLLILHERMINLPPATAPPLYRMVMDEVAQSKELRDYTHLVFFSRVFSSDAFSDEEEGDEEEDGREREGKSQGRKSAGAKHAKRRKAQTKKAIKNETIAKGAMDDAEEELGLFHPEDAFIAKKASHSLTFRFPAPKDAAKDFEAPLFGRIAVVPRGDRTMGQLIDEMQAAFEGTAPMALE